MRRFRAAALPAAGGPVWLDPDTSHHLLRVVGIAPGESVRLHDGQGAEAVAVLRAVQGGRALLDAAVPVALPAPPETILCVAVLKGPAFDLALRMAVELGVTAIFPVQADRSVPRGERVDRWARVVAAAADQCGRAVVPAVAEAAPLGRVLGALPAGLPLRLHLPGGPALPATDGPVGLLVGPEGGWSPAEVDLARAAGAVEAGLGPFVLRADTAVAAALSRARS
jgi:16S rRNA (uracil1498-N3)-methyltransferase